MHGRPRLTVLLVLAVTAGLLAPSAASAAPTDGTDDSLARTAARGPILGEGFETAADWTVVSGSGLLSSVSDSTEGTKSLAVNYDVGGRSFEIGRTATPVDIPTSGLRSLRLDVKGDGSYNTLYLRLRDATGEVFYYRVGNLNEITWATTAVDLSRPPASTSGGNGDGILDAPVALFRLVVVRNGTQPATGSVRVDNFVLEDLGWSAPGSASSSVIPGAGAADITFASGGAGDHRLRLHDPSGKVRTFNGTARSAAMVSLRWDGRADDGSPMAGVIRGVLEYDSTPDGQLTSPMSVASPYLIGAARRSEAETRGSAAAVNSTLTTYDSLAKADRDAAAMEDAYVRYAREEFEWNRVEPRDGFFDWPKFDQAVAVARARNVQLIGKLVYSADWASSAPAGTPSATARYYPPADYSDYVDYAVSTVERYKDQVKVWEVWNEPNIATYWKPAPDPAAYAGLLKATYAAIKEVQPDAIVISGGLAGYSEQYMNGLLSAGAMQSFDGFGLHTYVEGAPEPSTLDSWMSAAQSFLARHAPGKPIWITETGWSTCSTCAAGAGVTESEQAEYLSRSMLDAVEQGVAAYAWYSLVEFGGSGSRLDNYGLIEQSERRKPAFSAFARTAAALAGSVATGGVSPSTGSSVVVSDMASTSGLRARSLGHGGSSSIQAVTSRVGGAGAVALDYNHDASGAQGTSISTSIPVEGRPSAISVWVYGDNSSSPVYMKVEDARGEIFEAKVGNAGKAEWSRQTLYFDGLNPSFKSYGSNVDGRVDYPITVTELHVFKSTTSKTRGRIILDDIAAHYGTSVRGTVLHGRSFVTQAVYRSAPVSTTMPVTNSAAYLYDRGTLQALTVNSSLAAAVTVSPLPKFLVSTHRVDPVSARPGAPVSLRAVTGDRTVLTMQIYTTAGQLVRTITDSRAFTSAARDITWDGRRSDGSTASPGAYRFRLQAYGPDGRSVAWGRPFTIVG